MNALTVFIIPPVMLDHCEVVDVWLPKAPIGNLGTIVWFPAPYLYGDSLNVLHVLAVYVILPLTKIHEDPVPPVQFVIIYNKQSCVNALTTAQSPVQPPTPGVRLSAHTACPLPVLSTNTLPNPGLAGAP